MARESHQQQRLRYARQRALRAWGDDGQSRLEKKRALIVGLGGLGAPAATYLAGAGVGHLTLNDYDRVDLSNLHRQPLHATTDVGREKTRSASASLQALNPNVEIEPIGQRLFEHDLNTAVARHDIVIDCCDNFASRLAINAACVLASVPLVSAAAIRFEGQLAVFCNAGGQGPCYACFYHEQERVDEDCQGQGIAGSVAGVMGAMAANETLKQLLGLGADADGVLHCYDGLAGVWQRLRIAKSADCHVCGGLGAG